MRTWLVKTVVASCRFAKTANKIVAQMGTNLSYMTVSLKRAVGIRDDKS